MLALHARNHMHIGNFNPLFVVENLIARFLSCQYNHIDNFLSCQLDHCMPGRTHMYAQVPR